MELIKRINTSRDYEVEVLENQNHGSDPNWIRVSYSVAISTDSGEDVVAVLQYESLEHALKAADVLADFVSKHCK